MLYAFPIQFSAIIYLLAPLHNFFLICCYPFLVRDSSYLDFNFYDLSACLTSLNDS